MCEWKNKYINYEMKYAWMRKHDLLEQESKTKDICVGGSEVLARCLSNCGHTCKYVVSPWDLTFNLYFNIR